MPPLGVIPANIRINFTSPETRGTVLPDAENRTIVSSFVWTQYQSVTDRQMDRIVLASAVLCMASHANVL